MVGGGVRRPIPAPARPDELVYGDRDYKNWAGPIAMFVAAVISIWLFSAQTFYKGVIPNHVPQIGDLTFEVGFVLAVRSLYVVAVQVSGWPDHGRYREQLAAAERA